MYNKTTEELRLFVSSVKTMYNTCFPTLMFKSLSPNDFKLDLQYSEGFVKYNSWQINLFDNMHL